MTFNCFLHLCVFLTIIVIISAKSTENCRVVSLNEDEFNDIHNMMKAFNVFLVNNLETNKKVLEALTRGNLLAEENGRILRNVNTLTGVTRDAIRSSQELLTEKFKSSQESFRSMTNALNQATESNRQNSLKLFDAVSNCYGGEQLKPSRKSAVSFRQNKNGRDSKELKDNQNEEALREIMKDVKEVKSEMLLQKKSLDEVQEALLVRPFDCSAFSSSERCHKSGVYKIYPFGNDENPVEAYCDMDTDGGGWTVLLTRKKQPVQVNFTRSWKDYKDGFGDPSAEYWLGNEVMHRMTEKKDYTLRIEGTAEGLDKTWGEFAKFKIASEKKNYKIHFSEGTDGPLDFTSWEYHNDLEFSTYDKDNDKGSYHCAKDWKSGWWFREKCYEFLLTGVYGATDGTGLVFGSWTKDEPHYSFPNFAQMKIRPSK